MDSRLVRLLLLTVTLLLVKGLPLAAQETLLVKPGAAAPAFVCVEEDCARLAWLPAGASVAVVGQVEGRELEGSAQWHEVLLDCPCFDYESRTLTDVSALDSVEGSDGSVLWYPEFSPDGTRIATVHESILFIWDVNSGELLVQELLDEVPLQYMDISWSPDGTRIVAGGVGVVFTGEPVSRSVLLLLDAEGQARTSLNEQIGDVWGVAWSHDGTRIASIGDALRIRDAQQGTVLVTIDSRVTSAAWSPDDKRIVAGIGMEGTLQVWDAASGTLLNDLDTGCRVSGVAWSPDGSRIASASFGKDCGGLYIWDGTSPNPPDTLSESDWSINVVWSPDSKFLMSNHDFKLQILDPDDGRVLATLLEVGAGLIPGLADWSPDGNRIVAAGFVSTRQEGNKSARPKMENAAWVWDLTLIPEGQTRAFIHSSQLIPDAAADG